MGRKIPGRKHHGVKDPDKQRQQRLAKIKDKINAPPQNPEEQQIPKSLSRFIELKNKVKSGEFRKKTKKEKIPKAPKFPDEKPIPKFVQYPNESDRAFLNRVNKICQNVKSEAAFEKKYGVDIRRDEEGEITVTKRPKDALEKIVKEVRKEKKEKKNKKKKKRGEDEGPKLTKSQKWSLKKAEKKKRKQEENVKDFNLKDEVKFGEVVHAPPTLITPKNVEKSQSAPRPGAKQLLLKSLINQNDNKNDVQEPQKLNKNEKVIKTIDKKGKRKELPNALRRQLELQQKEVIEAYKQLKTQKYKQY